MFGRRPLALWLIDAGYHAASLVTIGAMLGGFAMIGHATSAGARTSSETLPSGERVLRHEVDVNAPPAAVWHAFTTSEGLRGFVAPVASIDVRRGRTVGTVALAW